MMTEVITVRNLSVRIDSPRGVVHALSEVSLELRRGETLAIVGESGSGKSMLVRSMIGILPAKATLSGSICFEGQELVGLPAGEARRVWGRRIAMVFQDPMTALNPVVRIGRQVSESARAHLGIGKAEAKALAIDLLRQVGIPEPETRFYAYPHELSGGMRQRVCIASALACEPDVLIADEATTALDVTVQNQILNLLQEIQRERNMAMILVSHDLGVVAGRSDQIAVMYGGRIVETAPTGFFFEAHRHRYSEALLSAIPRVDSEPHTRLATIPGWPPDLASPPLGCAFAARCGFATKECIDAVPEMRSAGDRHTFACIHPTSLGVPGVTSQLAEREPA